MMLNDQDDDSDICPVCDGECTCSTAQPPRPSPPHAPLSMAELSNLYASNPRPRLPSLPPSSPPAPKPSLKIKLTVPPTMLKKPTHATKKYTPSTETTSVVVADGYTPPSPYPSTFPKRRGRPPKHVVAAREAAKASQSPYTTKALLKKKTLPKPKKKRHIVESDLDLSSLSDISDHFSSSEHEDAESVQFPTFVSASALSSMEEGDADDSSSLSSFDADSELEKEEECFIRAEHDKARVKRELLGDDSSLNKRRDDWVIRPRKKSVGGSDVEMDLDTEASASEGEALEAGEEEDEDEDEEETDGGGPPVGAAGLVSGWSEDEESSFDADLFFANLSDSSSSTSSSVEDDGMIEDDDDTQSEMSYTAAPSLGLGQNMPFEITEAWDGQVVFTNGSEQGIFDIDFQVPRTTPEPEEDVDMLPMLEEEEEGYEEDEDASGDTTDEELVGEDSLPNERAMRLFSFPFSVSAINPLSTVSPAVSPVPLNRRPAPRPSDILSGRVFWDSDEERNGEGALVRPSGLRMGVFEVGEGERKEKKAVIDERNRGCGVPSPHPRFGRRGKKVGAVEQTLRKHLLSSPTPHTPTTPHPTPMSMSMDDASAPPSTESDQIEIYDVLEAAYLNEDEPSSMSESDSSSRKHLRHLERWNSIPVGAFRQTREAGGWKEDYGSIMKPSPLSAMLWSKSSGKKAISPVILPLQDRDRTPTASTSASTSSSEKRKQKEEGERKKSRQEMRRERKMKRKSCVRQQPQYGHGHHHHQQHYQHQHHPNSKSRSSGSVQRNFLGSVPPFNL